MAFEWHLSLSKLVPTPLLGITFHFTQQGRVLLLLIRPLLFSVVKLQEGLLCIHLFICSASFTEYLLCAAGFPSGAVIKNPPANAGDTNSIPGEENGKSLQYSCLENSVDREAWWATVHGVTKSQTWLSTHTHPTHILCGTRNTAANKAVTWWGMRSLWQLSATQGLRFCLVLPVSSCGQIYDRSSCHLVTV